MTVSSSMSNSAIIMPNWIGDSIMALSVLLQSRSLETNRPSLIVPDHLLDLIQKITPFDCISYNRTNSRERSRTIAIIRSRHFDRIHILPRSFSSAFMAFNTGIPQRIGLAGEWRSLLLSSALPRRLYDRSRHITYEFAAIMNTVWSGPAQWIRPTPVNLSNPVVDCGDYIVLCPGASYGPAKVWPGYGELIKKLPRKYSIIILGSSKEQMVARILSASDSDKKILDYTGKTSLTEAFSIIQSAKLVIANDSGLMHIAGFCGVPLVGIFGSTSPVWTGPLGTNHATIVATESCSPCFKRECRYDHYHCMRLITPESVLKAANSLEST